MNVIIADDHSIVRTGVRHLLETQQHVVVAELDRLDELKTAVAEHEPDLVILDYRIPGGDAFAYADYLKRRHNLKVIIFTASESATLFQELVNSRIDGVLSKQDSHEELLQAIDAIQEGRQYVSSRVESIVNDAAISLTARELQVLNMITLGLSGTVIAKQLGVSAETVKTHRKNLMRKLQVQNLSEMIQKAKDLDLC